MSGPADRIGPTRQISRCQITLMGNEAAFPSHPNPRAREDLPLDRLSDRTLIFNSEGTAPPGVQIASDRHYSSLELRHNYGQSDGAKETRH